jgi:hypothetical protein
MIQLKTTNAWDELYLNDQHLAVIPVNVEVQGQWTIQMKDTFKDSRGARIVGLRLVKVQLISSS